MPLISDLKTMARQLTQFADESQTRAIEDDDSVALGRARAFREAAKLVHSLMQKYTPEGHLARLHQRSLVMSEIAAADVIRQQRDTSR
jgi:hypothetical protein